jgi:hypothetical protein
VFFCPLSIKWAIVVFKIRLENSSDFLYLDSDFSPGREDERGE